MKTKKTKKTKQVDHTNQTLDIRHFWSGDRGMNPAVDKIKTEQPLPTSDITRKQFGNKLNDLRKDQAGK
jgi:hypothetical protein